MSLFAELKRRNVFKVGIAYVLMAWVALQAADFALDLIDAPNWVIQALFIIVIIGLPFALFFAWAFELTPEGIKREHEVDRSQSITPHTGKKLNFMIIGALAIAVIYLLADKHVLEDITPEPTERTVEVPSEAPAGQATPVDENSIAVLPFANRSRAEDDEFFVDGMHDDLLTQLAKIRGLKVISRTTMMQYKDTEKTIPEIAKDLGVSTILEGGVQRAGDRVRINAQLIDPTGDGHIWAETYDREMTVENLFDIQSEITRQIVSAVRGELSEEESEALAEQPTDNLAAYEAYLRGRAELDHPDYGTERAYAALEWLERAVELDPEFAHAWAKLAIAWTEVVWMANDNDASRQASLEALEKARALAPEDPETLLAEGAYAYRLKSDYRTAAEHFRVAAEKAPANSAALVWLATTERRMDEWNNALMHLQMAVDLDPGNMWVKSSYSETLLLFGQWDRAEPMIDSWRISYPEIPTFTAHKIFILLHKDGDIEAARRLLESMEPWGGVWYLFATTETYFFDRDYQALVDLVSSERIQSICADSSQWGTYCEHILTDAYHYMGQAETARYHATRTLELSEPDPGAAPQNRANLLASAAQVRATLGQYDLALATIDEALQLLPESEDSLDGRQIAISRAVILGQAGRRDEALAEIERLMALPFGISVMNLALHPRWDFFRDDPRFVALYAGDTGVDPLRQPLGDGT
jgi:TolB-like protein/Flp pilus assembly protein TadD